MARKAYIEVTDTLLRTLRNGEYAPGSRLPAERQLAEDLSVSRPVIREALAALELMGAVYTDVGAGTFVAEDIGTQNGHAPQLQDASPSEILTVRLMIEPEAARLAAANWDRQTLADIARPLKKVERAAEQNSSAHPTSEDRQFHAAITRACDNDVLTTLLTPMWSMMTQSLWRRLKTREWDPEHTRRVAVEHREIYDAIHSRDGALAAFMMEKHLRGVVMELYPSDRQS